MQINENEARDDQTREILDYYRGLPQRSSQETIVEMLRELQDVHGCISPDMLEQAAEAAGVRDSKNCKKASSVRMILANLQSGKTTNGGLPRKNSRPKLWWNLPPQSDSQEPIPLRHQSDRACGFVFYFPLLSFAFPVPSAVQ